MIHNQLAFDFDAKPAPVKRKVKHQPSSEVDMSAAERAARTKAYWEKESAAARAYWKVGMVTDLPCFCTIQGVGHRYTQMLPGVVESITGDTATVRIYAAPEYGYVLENYPLHGKLAVGLSLYDLGRFHCNHALERVVTDGLLESGDPALAIEVRARLKSLEVA